MGKVKKTAKSAKSTLAPKAWSMLVRILLFPLKCFTWTMAVGLLLCYISIYVSPARFWVLAYFGLAFQVFFVVNVLLLIVWSLAKKRLFLLHAIALFPSVFFLGGFLRLFTNEVMPNSQLKTLKVVTYNVQMFQLPFKKKDFTYHDIAQFLNEEKADVVCLQEFYTAKDKLSEKDFANMLRHMKYYYVYYSAQKKESSYGIATFSKYPIKMQVEIPFEGTANAAMYTDIDVDGTIVRVYNVHLQSVKLNLKKSLRRILGNQDEKRIDELEDVSTRLRTAFVKRAQQVDDVAQHIKVSPYPMILCGDFNDTPVSYTYNTVKGDMKDAFREAGTGMPSTYQGFFPSFRIDYILHHQQMKTLSYKVDNKTNFSDHYPVMATIAISE